jgi:hypothetical protein
MKFNLPLPQFINSSIKLKILSIIILTSTISLIVLSVTFIITEYQRERESLPLKSWPHWPQSPTSSRPTFTRRKANCWRDTTAAGQTTAP